MSRSTPNRKHFYRWLRRRGTAVLSRFRISEATFMTLLAAAIGALAGLGNFGFRKAIDFFHWLVVEQGMALFDISMTEWSFSRLVTIFFPAVGGILLLPLGFWFARDLHFGFPSFLETVNLRGAKLPLRTIFTRGMASAITLGTGGSAGQEGPIAQIGGAIGSQFGQAFKMGGGSTQGAGGLRRCRRGCRDLQCSDRGSFFRAGDCLAGVF